MTKSTAFKVRQTRLQIPAQSLIDDNLGQGLILFNADKDLGRVHCSENHPSPFRQDPNQAHIRCSGKPGLPLNMFTPELPFMKPHPIGSHMWYVPASIKSSNPRHLNFVEHRILFSSICIPRPSESVPVIQMATKSNL